MSAHLDASVETPDQSKPDHEANRLSSGTGIWHARNEMVDASPGYVDSWPAPGSGAAPAAADTKVFDDPVGDSTFVDISRVRVIHRDSVIVRVRSAVPLTAGQLYAFWIDAGHDRRPDYYVDFQPNTGFDACATSGIVGLGSFSARECGFAPTSLPPSRCRSESRDVA